MIAILSGISLGVFVIICVLALFKSHWALVLIFSLFGYDQLLSSFIPLFGHKTWLLNVIVGSVASISLLRMYLYGHRPFQNAVNGNSILIGCLVVFAYMGYFYSMMPAAGLYFIKTGFPYVVLFLVIFPSLVTSIEQIRKMCLPLLLAGCALIVLILISPRTQFYGMRMFIDLSFTQGNDTRGNPLAIAELGGLLVIVASLMGHQGQGVFIKLIRLLSIALGISIGFLAATRGQLIFSIFLSVLLYPVAYQIKNIGQFFMSAASIGAVAGFMLVIAKLFLFSTDSSGRFSGADITDGFSGRVFMVTTMLKEYISSPAHYLQGLGTGSYNAILPPSGDDSFLYPHNLIVEVLTHHGLIGFTLLVGIFTVTAVHTIKLIRLIPTGTIDRGSVAIIIALAGYWTLISMKQGSFLLIPIPFFMYLVISKIYLHSVANSTLLHEYDDDSSDIFSNEYEYEYGSDLYSVDEQHIYDET